MNNKHQVIVDETCNEHGGENFIYQYEDENFVRLESVCEGCTSPTQHTPSEELQAARATRDHSRPVRG